MTTMLIMTMTSIMFMMMKHPLSMGIMLMIQTILTAITTGSMMKSFWFSYILIMIMLSGMLVLFMYMASMASNEKFNSPTKISLIMTPLIITMMSTMNLDKTFLNKITKPESTMSLSEGPIMEMNKMFNMEMMPITILMVTYLLFTMIVVTYNTNNWEGPMRSKN